MKKNNDNIFTVNYSGNQYIFQLYMYHLSTMNMNNLTEKDVDFAVPITQDIFKEFKIISDIRYPILLGHLILRDTGRQLIQNVTNLDGYTLLYVNITTVENKKPIVFSHTFIVSDFNVMDIASGILKYELVSKDWFKFNNYIEYSNQKNESYTKILRDLITQGNMNCELEGNEGSYKRNFMTPYNWSLLKSVSYLLDRCADVENGMYILKNDVMFNRYKIINLNSKFNKLKDIDIAANELDIRNFFEISNQTGSTISAQQTLSLANIQSSGHFESHFEQSKPHVSYSFDYDYNQWNTTEYNYTNLNNILPLIKKDDKRNRLKEYPNFINKTDKKNVKNVFDISYLLNKEMNSLFTETMFISSKVYGYINRWAGDIISIFTNDQSRDMATNNYNGFWLAFKVVHKWGGTDTYANDIFISKIDRPVNHLRNN